MKKYLCFILAIVLCLSIATPALAANSLPTFDYDLSVGKTFEHTVTVKTKDTVTVQFRLLSPEDTTLSTFQDQIIYDHNFFDLVEGSIKVDEMFKGYISTSNPIDTDEAQTHYVYYNTTNTLDFYAEDREEGIIVGTFQLYVKATSGSSIVRNTKCKASDSVGDEFGSEVHDLTVTIGGTNTPVTGVTLSPKPASVKVGENVTLTATVAPSNATNKAVTWSSDNEDVATVNDGVVTGVSVGTANITVTTTDGNKTDVCAVTVTSASTPHSHSLSHTDAKSATCSAQGNSEYWYCSGCQKYFSDSQANTEITQAETVTQKNASNHSDLKNTAAKAATCAAAGNKEYWYCSGCQKYFSNAAGTTETTLADTVTQKNASNHTDLQSTAAKAATCKDNGNIAYWYCSGCQKYYSDATAKTEITQAETVTQKSATNHFTTLSHTDAKAATCTATGNIEYWYCSGCQKYYSDAAAKTEIKLADTVTQKAASNHSATLSHTDAKTATCSATGNKEYWYCSGCQKYFSNAAGTTEIAKTSIETQKNATNHSATLSHTAAKAATCSAQGNSEYWYCSGCQKYFSNATGTTEIKLADTVTQKNATNHSATLSHTAAKAATCSATGNSEYWYCSGCQKYFSNSTGTTEVKLADTVTQKNATNHSATLKKTDAKAATCSATGNSAYWYCSGCQKYFSNSTGTTEVKLADTVTQKNASNHTNLQGTAAKAATCKTKGNIAYWYCSGCQKYFSNAAGTVEIAQSAIVTDVNSNNHESANTHLEGAKKATCKTKGYTGDTCYDCCNAVKTQGTEINFDSTNHESTKTYFEGAKAATCIAMGSTGTEKYSCCGAVKTVAQDIKIDATNHVGNTEVRNAKAATLTEEGYSGDTYCLSCQNLIKAGQALPMLPQIIEGDGQELTVSKNPKTGASFIIKCNSKDVVKIILGSELLKTTDYTIEDAGEGLTKVTLKPEILKTMEKAEHEITVETISGSATATFTLVAPTNPEDGDNSNVLLATVIMMMSAMAMGAVVVLGKKKHI